MKRNLQLAIENAGWFLRRIREPGTGTNLFHDLKRLKLPRPATILDIGAHEGESSLEYAFRFPAARIYAFEPVAANFARARTNAAHEPPIACIYSAVGGADGSVAIASQPDSRTHSLNRLARPGEPSETVAVTTLDSFIKSCPIAAPVFMKVDVEGYELKVVAGAHGFLSVGAVSALLLEATFDPTDDVHTQLADLQGALGSYGYHLAGLYDQVIWQDPSRLAYFNALFIHGRAARRPLGLPGRAGGS